MNLRNIVHVSELQFTNYVGKWELNGYTIEYMQKKQADR